MNNIEPTEKLDLKGVPCPQNSAKALLKLQLMDSGEILEVILDDGEPLENVPASIDEATGYEITLKEKIDDKLWRLLIKVL
jgi:TusA-related sulfurtransferase